MDLNKAQVMWHITQDIELKQTPNGQNVCSFSIATNRNWKDADGNKQEQVEFHNIVLWWKLSEIADQYLKKGSKVFIEWRLQTRSWEAKDETKRYKTEIVGENMIMLDSKGWKSNAEDTTDYSSKPKANKSQSKEDEEISIEDIPF